MNLVLTVVNDAREMCPHKQTTTHKHERGARDTNTHTHTPVAPHNDRKFGKKHQRLKKRKTEAHTTAQHNTTQHSTTQAKTHTLTHDEHTHTQTMQTEKKVERKPPRRNTENARQSGVYGESPLNFKQTQF